MDMDNSSAHCLFCKIVQKLEAGIIVYDDPSVVAFEDIHPKAPTHLLVVPRKHIESLDALSPEDEVLMGHMQQVAAQLARERGLHRSGYRTVINTGVHAGQSVFHVHLHLLGGRYLSWPPG